MNQARLETAHPAPRMRIGNQTALAAGDAMTPYRFALHHGFSAFEWFSDAHGDRGFTFGSLDGDARTALRHEAAARDMRFSVHAPWEADPWREGDGAVLHESIAFAAGIGADVVVVHFNHAAPLEAFVDALRPAAERARELGVRIALENTVLATPAMFNAMFAGLVPRDLAPTLGMCLDIGHANLCPDTMYDYIGYLDQLAPHVPIIHIHLHENFGDADSHLTLFTGPASVDDAGVRALLRGLAERNYDGSLILEQWPDPPELLVHARDRLCAMMSG